MRHVHSKSAALLALALIASAGAHAQNCATEQYFDPQDSGNAHPLAKPSGEFAKSLRLANRGNVVEQRNIAISYETGYLVTPCAARAAYWYAKAARGGDEIARTWLEKNARVERMRRGPECYDINCSLVAGEAVSAMMLEADANGHYSAPVTVNGVTVRGLIDTGATAISMGVATAQKMGIAYQNGRRAQMITANGTTSGYAVVLNSVTVGSITLSQVQAVVSESETPLLIGSSFLNRVSVSIDGKRMTLTKR